MREFAKRTKNLDISLIRYMRILAENVPNSISLGQGIPYFELYGEIKEKLTQALKTNKEINKYTLSKGIFPLREEIAKSIKKEKGAIVKPEREICITSGVITGLFCALYALVDKNDEVILFDPTYEAFIKQSKLVEGKIRFVPLIEKNGWQVDFKKLENAISKKTKAIIFCNPSNPTGSLLKKEELIEIGKIALKNNLFVLVDETYDYIVYDNNNYFSLLSLDKLRKILITFVGFSKRYALTGFRVGCIIAREKLLRKIERVFDLISICAPTISQYAALFALKSNQDFVAKYKKELTENRELVCQRLDKLKDLFEYQKPAGSYFIFPKFKLKMKSVEFSKKLLFEAKVVAIPGITFGPSGENHIRISFGEKKENIQEAFNRIDNWWKNYKAKNKKL